MSPMWRANVYDVLHRPTRGNMDEQGLTTRRRGGVRMNDTTIRDILHKIAGYISLKISRLERDKPYPKDGKDLTRFKNLYRTVYLMLSGFALLISSLIIAIAAMLADKLIK